MRSLAVFLALLFLVCSAFAVGEARELFLKATDMVAIRSTFASQDTRLLVKFQMPDILTGKSVDFAGAELAVGSGGEKGIVSLEAFQVTTAWNSASVSWAHPWSKSGGDWDNTVSADAVVPVGEGKTAYLDITDFVNGWLKDPSNNFGILVKVSEPYAGTLSAIGSQGLPKLRILY